MEAIKGWILNISAVAVLMVILDLIMPEGRIRKFTQLLTGFIIMFVMINPVMALFGRGVPDSFAGWEEEAFLWNHQVQQMSENYKQGQNRQTLELCRKMLLSDIQGRLESHHQIRKAEVDIVLNENEASEKFGEIRKLYVNLVLFSEEDLSNNRKKGLQDPSGLLEEIKKELQQVFLLRENDIQIQVSSKD